MATHETINFLISPVFTLSTRTYGNGIAVSLWTKMENGIQYKINYLAILKQYWNARCIIVTRYRDYTSSGPYTILYMSRVECCGTSARRTTVSVGSHVDVQCMRLKDYRPIGCVSLSKIYFSQNAKHLYT